jgi:bis(5'-nucleosidyl)-tetraphosphatase
MVAMLKEKSCGAVVFRRNSEEKYLILHYGAGHWDFVKGNVEPDENEEDTAMRELKEETGIAKAQFVEGFMETISYFYRRGNSTVHKEVVFFLVQTTESRVDLSYEHVGYEWLNYEGAIERLTFENAKKVLQKAHRFLKKD